jgi:hypothetical protein
MRVSFENALIESLCIHKVGNKATEGHLQLSHHQFVLKEEETEELLMKYFTRPFSKNPMSYHFKNLENNPLFLRSAALLGSGENFVLKTQDLANQLWNASDHPSIPLGDFVVIKFRDIQFEDQLVNGLGLYKCDNKDTFLQIGTHSSGETQMHFQQGINLNKLDKSALILGLFEEEGFVVYSTETKSKSEANQYWEKLFLNLEPYKDSYFTTLQALELCTDFIQTEAERNPKETKTLQAQLLSKTAEYFHNHENFDHQEIGDLLFEENAASKESFFAYLGQYNEELVDDKAVKPIATEALKKGQKYFKSIFKLDRYFHVYVHGGAERMEKGFDSSKKLHYYKLYFETEQ